MGQAPTTGPRDSEGSRKLRLLVRGSTIAAGYGSRKSYVDILRDYYGPRGIQVINRSRAGENSFDGVWTFEKDINPFRPDFLILHFGIDDAFSAVYRSEFKENIVRIIRMARASFDSKILLLTSHPIEGVHERDAVEIFYRALREISADLDCYLIPVHTFWAGYLLESGSRSESLVETDPMVPNEKGHQLIARTIIERLDRMLPG